VLPKVQIGSHLFTFDHVYGSTGSPSSTILKNVLLHLLMVCSMATMLRFLHMDRLVLVRHIPLREKCSKKGPIFEIGHFIYYWIWHCLENTSYKFLWLSCYTMKSVSIASNSPRASPWPRRLAIFIFYYCIPVGLEI
jgi:hypothetical protein